MVAPTTEADSISADQTTNARGATELGPPAQQTVETVEMKQRPAETRDGSTVATVDSTALDPRDKANYEIDGPWAYAETVKGRIFTVMSNLVHPDTGTVLATPEGVNSAAARKGNTRSAWIIHDRDTWDADDVAKNPRAVVGGVKPTHFHAVEERKNQTTLGAVARAYGVPPNFVKVKKGRGVFEDCAEYLTHEHPDQQAKGKHLYSDDEVTAYGFDFRETVDARVQDRKEGGRRKAFSRQSPIDVLALRIQDEGLTLRQAQQEDSLAYSRGTARMETARRTYLKTAPLPPFRTNYYIGGKARTGKSKIAEVFAAALAARMYPDLAFDEAVYMVGRSTVAFQTYDGQPILLWDDYRPWTLIEAFKGREGVWTSLDISPKRVQVNKKNGAVTLLNAVNIITGVQSYEEFLDGLAGEYVDTSGKQHTAEDKNQAYGRFPFVSEVTRETIRFYMNEGFADGTKSMQDYAEFATLQANMKTVSQTLEALKPADREQVRKVIGSQMCAELVSAHEGLHKPVELSQDDAVAKIMAGVTVLDVGATGDVQADQRKARLDQAEMRTRCQAHADGHTAHRILGGRPSRHFVVPDEMTPSGLGITPKGAPDMSLWDADAQTYNGQPARGWSDVSDDFKWPADVRLERQNRRDGLA